MTKAQHTPAAPVTFEGVHNGKSYFFDLFPENQKKSFNLFCEIRRKLKDGSRGARIWHPNNSFDIWASNREAGLAALAKHCTEGK